MHFVVWTFWLGTLLAGCAFGCTVLRRGDRGEVKGTGMEGEGVRRRRALFSAPTPKPQYEVGTVSVGS